MPYVIETYRPNGSVAMSGSNKAGIFIEVLLVAWNNESGSKVYPQIPAGQMYVVVGDSGGRHDFTVDSDGAGHARINWTPYAGGTSGSPTPFVIFAKKVNKTDLYRIELSNDDGDDLLDYTFPVPQYAGTIQPAAQASRAYDCSSDGGLPNYTAYEHEVVLSLRPGTHRMVLVNLPDSSSTDIWYSCKSFVATDSGSVTLTLTVFQPNSATPYQQVPTLHIFSLNGPVSGGEAYAMRYFTPSAAVVYDSSAENISIKDLTSVEFSGGDLVKAMAMPAAPGVSLPYIHQRTHRRLDPYNGVWETKQTVAQRRGATMIYGYKHVRSVATSQAEANGGLYLGTYAGTQSACFSLLVDIAQLNPSSVTRIP